MDQALPDLINRRVRLTGHIGKIKPRSGVPCRDREREQNLYLRISLSNDGPLTDSGAQRIFEILTAESRQLQQSLRAPDRLPEERDR